MHPDIVSFGPFAIRAYGLMLAIGFMAGIMYAARRARLMGEDPDHMYNISIWLVLSSIFGARIYYIATHYSEFRALPGTPFFERLFYELRSMFWPVNEFGKVGVNGLVLYGGLIAATAAAAWYLRRHRLSIPKYMDLMAPSLGIGIMFTRIGCFLNGCCYGIPTDSGLGVHFPVDSAPAFHYHGQAVHPSQLYQSLAGLVIFLALIWAERKFKRFDGFTALLFFMLYSVARFIIDYFRYYESNLTYFGLSHNQVLSIGVFLVAGGLLVVLNTRAAKRKSI